MLCLKTSLIFCVNYHIAGFLCRNVTSLMHLIYFLIFFGSFLMKTCLLIFSSSLNCDVECVSHVCSCSFTDGLKPDTKMLLTAASKKKSKGGKGDMTKEDESSKNDSAQPITISLIFKRYVFDTQKKMIQS